MTITPWGDSAALRDRKLRPGTGVPPAEVAKNQRERLFAAMVATIDEKGFEATTVADLLALSGVSRTTFYDHFDDKRDCFVAAVEAIVEATTRIAAKRFRASTDGEAKAHALLEAFVELIVSQPAASRMCFVESYAAGPGAVSAMWRAVDSFQTLFGDAIDENRERQAMPDAMRRAIIGAVYLIVHARLYRREEEELTSLTPQLWEWAFNHRPPPQPLALPKPRRAVVFSEGLPRAPVVVPDPAERIVRGFASAVAEHGYSGTTIADISDRASISQTTFYSAFKGRKEVLLSAIDTAGALMMAAMLPAARRGADWPDSMRLAIAAMGAFGATEPDFASLLAVGVYAAGPLALVRRDEVTTDGLRGLFVPGYELSPEAAPIAAEGAVSVIYSLMYNQIALAGPQSLPEIVPMATYIALLPFVGAEQACAVVNGD